MKARSAGVCAAKAKLQAGAPKAHHPTRPAGRPEAQRGVIPFDVMAAALPWLALFGLGVLQLKCIRPHLRIL